MSTALPEFLDLSFREDLDLLFSRWLRATDDAEVQQGYEAALAVALPRHARYWLLDIRRRGLSSPTATRWVVDTFLPHLAACMGEKVYLAYLLSPSHLQDVPPATYSPQAPASYASGMFSDEGSALQWLTACHQAENEAAAAQPQTIVSAG